MTISCDLVQDILPLYHDGICSEDIKRIVEEHLSQCDECKAVLARISDTRVDDSLALERDDVVRHHTQAVKRKSMIVGISIASIMAVPIVVCLIVNLISNHALDWFFIVLTALMTAASLTVVPLIMEERKGLWTLGSFAGSLTLLLLTCCIYTGGDWFAVAMIPILFSLSVLFAPFVIAQIPLKGFASANKGLLAMIVDTILLFAVVIVSGLYGGYTLTTNSIGKCFEESAQRIAPLEITSIRLWGISLYCGRITRMAAYLILLFPHKCYNLKGILERSLLTAVHTAFSFFNASFAAFKNTASNFTGSVAFFNR